MCRRRVAHSNKSELRYDSQESSELKILTSIRAHYLEDLQPYLCLHDGCSSQDIRYSTIDEWTSHIRTSHGQVFRCIFGCNEPFHARSTFEEHMVDEHCAQFTSQELPTLAELCMKHTLATSATQCPCCGETTESSDHLYRHLAKHLEDIALLSLTPKLPCKFSTDADPALQLADTIPSHFDQENALQSTEPKQKHARVRTDDRDTHGTPRRTRSAPRLERELGIGFYDNVILDDISGEPLNSQDFMFRRHSWNSPSSTTQSLAVDPNILEPRRTEVSLDDDATSSNVTVGHESTSLVDQSIPASSEVRKEQGHTPKEGPRPFEVDEEGFRTIFSPESGYQYLEVLNDDSGPVCFVTFDGIVSAFRAAYKLNHRLVSDSNATRLSIDFSGNSLSVRVAAGPPPDQPLLSAVERYHVPVKVVPVAHYVEQYQDHEQTDQSSWEAETYARGSASLDSLSD